MSYFSFLHIYMLAFLFTSQVSKVFSLVAKICSWQIFKIILGVLCVESSSYPEAFLLGSPFFCFSPAGFSAAQLHNYYSGTLLTPDLPPLLSESSVFLLHSLYPHFTGVLALVSSLEMMCGR